VITELWTVDRLRWAEFEILLVAGPLVGGFNWDTDAAWDGSRTSWDALLMRGLTMERVIALVNEVKAAHSRLVRVIHVMDGFLWNNDTPWDSHPHNPNARWDGDIVWVI